MNDELKRIRKEAVLAWTTHYPGINLEELGKTMKEHRTAGISAVLITSLRHIGLSD
jgi:hypothetical protein